MMSVKEYSEDVGLELKEILDLCKKLGIKVSNEDDMLDEDSIILLDNEIANGESSEEEVQEEVHEDLTEFEEDEVIEDEDGGCCQTCAFGIIGENDDVWSESGMIIVEPCKSCKHNIPPMSEEYENAPSHYVSLNDLHYKEKE